MRRSPVLEFWLYGFKSNAQREHSDFSHDTCCISQDVYSLLASELCQIQAEACGCFQLILQPNVERHVLPGWIRMYILSSGLACNSQALTVL